MNLSTLTHIGIAVALTPQGDLRLEALPGLLTPELLAQIAQSKPLLLNELECPRELVNLVNMDSYGQAMTKDAERVEAEVNSAPQATPPEHMDPNAWGLPAIAYNTHHFTCLTCIAAGRGASYGLRCGIGMTLWTAYQAAI